MDREIFAGARARGWRREARSRRTRSGRTSSSSPVARCLASEIVKADLDVRDDLTRVLWRDIFRAGLERMQYDGRIDASADPAQLAHMLIAAYQGGSLLAQIARDVAPLRDALYAAVEHLRAYATLDGVV